ncbi:MAG TPA: hypothetical protein VHW03_03590 [Chthoniobacterales bacterium]|nr:hypothetical protein [Chthoniobacterales bacterium]
MTTRGQVLQIVPRAPGSHEGVGDYAQLLAHGLREEGYLTTFVAAQPAERSDVLSPLDSISDAQWREHPAAAIILHYVNYGYHPRGVPRDLPGKMARIQGLSGARLITIFHELYASGSWRQSAFWLQPLQRRIVRRLAQNSKICVVSSEAFANQLERLAPVAPVIVRPVVSTFGEPNLSAEQVRQRASRRWAICGGNELIARSLRSFAQSFSGSAELFVIGGTEQSALKQLLHGRESISAHFLPNVDAAAASEALSSCAFGWIDYFEHANAVTAAILKSTAFAALCAHAVIPVFPQPGSAIALQGDAVPGPFLLQNLPPDSERPRVAQAFYDWYRRHASSTHLAASIAAAIRS